MGLDKLQGKGVTHFSDSYGGGPLIKEPVHLRNPYGITLFANIEAFMGGLDKLQGKGVTHYSDSYGGGPLMKEPVYLRNPYGITSPDTKE